jgi:Family of unknown function (DUF5675)
MVNVIIGRIKAWETLRSVSGVMLLDDVFQCYTLEPARINPVIPGHPCIVAGTFKVILTPSPHLGYVTPEVLDVPGRTAIPWHIANRPEDLEGCVGVGESHSTDWVGNSKVAFKFLMDKLSGQDIIAQYIEDYQYQENSPANPV